MSSAILRIFAQTITLPADFEPQRVQVRLKPHGKGAKTVEEFYVWAPETG